MFLCKEIREGLLIYFRNRPL